MTQQKENTLENFSISLFENGFKKTEQHPAYTGKIEINGKKYKMSLWNNKKDKNGKTYFGVTFTEDLYKKEDGNKSEDNNLTNESPFDF